MKIFVLIALITIPASVVGNSDEVSKGDLILNLKSLEKKYEHNKQEYTKEEYMDFYALRKEIKDKKEEFLPGLKEKYPYSHQAFDRKLFEYNHARTKFKTLERCRVSLTVDGGKCLVNIYMNADNEHIWGRVSFNLDDGYDIPVRLYLKTLSKVEYTVERMFVDHKRIDFKLKYEKDEEVGSEKQKYDLQVGIVSDEYIWAIKTIPLPYDPIEDKFAELDELLEERFGKDKEIKKMRSMFERYLEMKYQEKGCDYNKKTLASTSESCRDMYFPSAVLP